VSCIPLKADSWLYALSINSNFVILGKVPKSPTILSAEERSYACTRRHFRARFGPAGITLEEASPLDVVDVLCAEENTLHGIR
jgi:hypothetical protein